MISIIIPTLNEEKYLPNLLESIKNQDYADYEIIVADASSTDKTLQIAKSHNCLIVKGGSPAVGRNRGTKAAKGDTLLFLDADTVLPPEFLSKSVSQFKGKNLTVASYQLKFFPGSMLFSFLVELFYNRTAVSLEKFYTHGATGIMIKKDVFEKLGGYDEKMKFCEDRDLIKRAAKKGKFAIIRNTKLLVSDRRFRKDGWFRTLFNYFRAELHLLIFGKVKNDLFKYEFGNYDNERY